MRYKEHTISKLEGQLSKLRSLHRGIENALITPRQALELIESIEKNIRSVIDRLELESDE